MTRTNPKAIPEAIVEYSIVVTNTGGSTLHRCEHPRSAAIGNTRSCKAATPASTDVEVQVGAGAPTRCVAETPTDTNATAATATARVSSIVGAPMAVSTVNTGAANAVTVRFRVTDQLSMGDRHDFD